MHTVSNLYSRLLANRNHCVEAKLVIAGEEYSQADIVADSLSVYGGLYSSFGIGNCCARQIDFQIFPKGTIPRQAKVEVYARLVAGEQASEWIPKGVFFFATRQTDRKTGVLTVHGYDAMLKAEETWLDSSYDSETWPMPAATAVADIAQRMGITVDSRTVLETAFPVQYPVDDDGDMTMREALARIAVSNAGNWIITDEGALLLVGLYSLPEETSNLLTESGDALTVGGTRILV